MFCFADKEARESPSPVEKLELHRNKLGEKRVSFAVTANATGVKEILYK